MTARIHHIVTGELESSLTVSLLNGGASPQLDQAEVRPYGWREDIRRRDGSFSQGVMVPVPVWLIEGADRVTLVDTGLGDVEEVATMQSRYGVEFVAERNAGQDLITGLADHGVEPGASIR